MTCAHSSGLWHRARLGSITCALSWILCEINPAIKQARLRRDPVSSEYKKLAGSCSHLGSQDIGHIVWKFVYQRTHNFFSILNRINLVKIFTSFFSKTRSWLLHLHLHLPNVTFLSVFCYDVQLITMETLKVKGGDDLVSFWRKYYAERDPVLSNNGWFLLYITSHVLTAGPWLRQQVVSGKWKLNKCWASQQIRSKYRTALRPRMGN